MNVYTLFIRALRWNTVEALVYQAILLTHQLLLFKVLGTSDYGLIGSLFSLVYLSVTLVNVGLECSLSPFFAHYMRSRKNFVTLLAPQMLINLTAFAGLSGLAYCFQPKAFSAAAATPGLFLVLAALIILESTKKVMRVILQLAFQNKQTALIEVGMVLSFVTLVWGGYCCGFPLNLYHIFIPMLTVSAGSTLILSYHVWRLYRSLPSAISTVSWTDHLRISKSRLFTYANQLTHSLFSGNFLVPFFAVQFGLGQAGIFKLVSSISYGITICLRKIFSSSSEALLTHVKNEPKEQQQQAFFGATTILYQVLIGTLLFFTINYQSFERLYHVGNQWMLICFFFILNFSEHFFLMYEKLFITQERAHHLFIVTATTLCFLYVILYNYAYVSLLATLASLLALRVATFAIFSITSFYTWRVRPTIVVRPVFLVSVLALSFTTLLLAKILL